MPAAERTTPTDVRRLVLVQLAMTAGFLVLVVVLLQGLDAEFPPIWLVVVALALVVVGAVLAERTWLRITPLEPGTEDPQGTALTRYVSQTTVKFALCEGALLAVVLLAFISDRAGWLVVVAGIPGWLVLAFETWPTLRNLSLAESMLDSAGVPSDLIAGFETS